MLRKRAPKCKHISPSIHHTDSSGSKPKKRKKRTPSSTSESVRRKKRKKAHKKFNLTDFGNAERFVSQHGDNVRYCHAWKKWLVWDGRRWKIDDTAEVERLAKRTVRSIYAEAAAEDGDNCRRDIVEFATASERKERIAATLSLAQSEQPLPVRVDDLDCEAWLLNVENGTIDLRNRNLREHHRKDYLTKLSPVEYPAEPGVDAVLWQSFLDRIFDGNVKIIGFVQRLIGMALVGEVLEHVLPIFYGTGANGKSVFIETICGMLGEDYAMKAAQGMLTKSKQESHPTGQTDLFGKRFVAAVETEDNRRLAESRVK